jgi:FSR family fosmidomycin resistance protein-like MFS transporter
MAGCGAALLGNLADRTSIQFVYQVCAYLPALGLLTAFLPNIDGPRADRRALTEFPEPLTSVRGSESA